MTATVIGATTTGGLLFRLPNEFPHQVDERKRQGRKDEYVLNEV